MESATAAWDDAELVNAIHRGENGLVSVLADRYMKVIYNMIRQRVAESDVEDLVQDILVALVRSIHTFHQESSLRTWIHAIVNNKLRYYFRQKKVRSRVAHFTATEDEDGESESAESRVAGGEDPGDAVAQKDENSIVLQVLSDLKEDYREILYLRFTDEISFAEIAQHLSLSLEAVKSRYRRAVDVVRRKLRRLNKP